MVDILLRGEVELAITNHKQMRMLAYGGGF